MMPRARAALLSVALLLPALAPAGDGSDSEIKKTFEAFVAAQTAHDARAVGELLWDGTGFVWITRGTVIWGREAALRRFEANYAGTWRLDPDMGQFRVTMLGADVAEIFVPLTVTAGPTGQPAQAVAIHMNQVLVRTPGGWKIASILPIPVPKG